MNQRFFISSRCKCLFLTSIYDLRMSVEIYAKWLCNPELWTVGVMILKKEPQPVYQLNKFKKVGPFPPPLQIQTHMNLDHWLPPLSCVPDGNALIYRAGGKHRLFRGTPLKIFCTATVSVVGTAHRPATTLLCSGQASQQRQGKMLGGLV